MLTEQQMKDFCNCTAVKECQKCSLGKIRIKQNSACAEIVFQEYKKTLNRLTQINDIAHDNMQNDINGIYTVNFKEIYNLSLGKE
jgi:hypothetical protein